MSKRRFDQIEEERQKLREQSNSLQRKYLRTEIANNGAEIHYYLQSSLKDRIKFWKTRYDLCSLEIRAIRMIMSVYNINEHCFAHVYKEYIDLLSDYERDKKFYEELFKTYIC